MTKARNRQEKRRTGRGRNRMLGRRIAAGLLVMLAAALALSIRGIALSPAKLMWGAACALLLLEALMLSVRLPVSRALQWMLGVLCLSLLALGFLNHNYVRLDGRFIPRYALLTEVRVTDKYPAHFEQMESLETLDMRGSTVTDFAPIRSLSALRQADLRENYAFTQQERDALAEALPGCDIRWSVPVLDSHFDSAQESVDLTALPLSIPELKSLFNRYPDKDFSYHVPLCGARYAPDTEALDLRGEVPDVEGLEEALELLTAVKSVDLRGEKASAQTVSALCGAHPDIRFMFTCDVPSGTMTTEDEQVIVGGTYEDLTAYMAFLDYMPNLRRLDASAIELTDGQVDALAASAHSDKLLYGVMAFGVRVSSQATELNLDNIRISGVEEVERCLARLPKLQKVSMCDCGLSESQMGQLFDAHPEIKFVWWIEFGHYRLRTDATSFSTLLGTGNRYGYDNATFAPIRYCTDLMMLDLGHNHITSLDDFRGLKKLRVLILADNQITDISALAELQDLEYVELFLNEITDVTPLTGLKHLVDLNIFYNPLYDNHKALKSMTWLERLWIGGCRLSKQDVAELRRALPNTRINVEGRGSTGKGWRVNSHYDTLKRMYEEGRYIPFD